METQDKVKLLFVITKLELGGAQKQLLSIIKGLDKTKFNITLFTSKGGELSEYALTLKGVTIRESICLAGAINPVRDLFSLLELYFYIKNNRIQIVHTHSSKAGILGRCAACLAGVDIIIHTVHGWSFNDFQPIFLRKLFIMLERVSALFTDALIVVSLYDKNKGLKNQIGNDSKYTLIRYGINYEEFSLEDQSYRREIGLNSQDLVVGMIACFKPQKCPQDFIRVASFLAKDNPDLRFILVGDGILRKQIEHLIKKHELQKQIILTGWRRDLSRILSAFDIFVLTSLWEGLPVSVLEAIAAFKPVVVTNTGGVSEVILENQTGFLAPLHDINSLSQKIKNLLGDKGLRKRIASNAFSYIGRDFTSDIMVEKTQQLYYNLYVRRLKTPSFKTGTKEA